MRVLLQANSSQNDVTNTVVNCGLTNCGVINWWTMAAGIFAVILLILLAYRLKKALALQRALRHGRVPVTKLLDEERLGTGEHRLELLARTPAHNELFQQQECPICLSNVTKRRRWVQLHCGHGTCKKCLYQLVQTKGVKSDCPLCRAALFQSSDSVDGEAVAPQDLELAAAGTGAGAEAEAEAAGAGAEAAAAAAAGGFAAAAGAAGGPAAGEAGVVTPARAAGVPAGATETPGSGRVELSREGPSAGLQS